MATPNTDGRFEFDVDTSGVTVTLWNGVNGPAWYKSANSSINALEITKGTDFWLPITVIQGETTDVVDLSGYSGATFTLRSHWDSSTALASWSQSGGEITLSATAPNVVLSLTDTVTDALDFVQGTFSLYLDSGSFIINALEGYARLKQGG